MENHVEEAKRFLRANNYEYKLLLNDKSDHLDKEAIAKLKKFCENNSKKKLP